MVKHIVLWKIRDDADKQKNIDRMIKMLTSLVGKVEGLVSVETGYNFNVDSDYDVVLYATLKNPVALKYYQNHPEHVKCKDFIGQIAIGRTAADYFYEEEITSSRPFDEVPDAPSVPETETPFTEPKQEENPFLFNKDIDIEVTPAAPSETVSKPIKENSFFGRQFENEFASKSISEPVNEPMENNAPFAFEQKSSESQSVFKPVAPSHVQEPVKPAAPAKQVSTQTNPVSTENQTIKETTSIFGKKKIDVEVTPLEQRSDTWTCPNCGKVMPNYVGTCGCGETKPFDFAPSVPTDNGTQNLAPAPKQFKPSNPVAPKPAAPAPKKQVSTQTNPVSTENQTIKETTSIFGKKKIDVDVTPLEQRSDTWTCPNCGKIMPKYVGTCGCGEPQPFDFGPSEPEPTNIPQESSPFAPSPVPAAEPQQEQEMPSFFNNGNNAPLPNIASEKKTAQHMSKEDMQNFSDVEPSLESYNPQIKAEEKPFEPQNDFSFIRNDNFEAKPMTFSDTPPVQEQSQALNFGNVPPPTPMRFNDDPSASTNFGNETAPAPMRFSDVQPNVQPMKAPTPPEPTKAKREKRGKKPLFGKKAKEEEVFRQAQEAVNNRKDVPNNGTWTCPNCGKVMPKYVGTCGCGEQQPFEF